MQKMIFNKAALVLSSCLFVLFFCSCRKNVPAVAEQTIAEEPAPEKHGLCEISRQYKDGFDCISLNDSVWSIVEPYLPNDVRPQMEVELPDIFDLFKKENVLIYIKMAGDGNAFLANFRWYLPSQGLLYYYDKKDASFRLCYTHMPQPTYAEIKEELTQTDGNTTAAMNCEVRNNKVYSIQGIIRL